MVKKRRIRGAPFYSIATRMLPIHQPRYKGRRIVYSVLDENDNSDFTNKENFPINYTVRYVYQ